MMSNEEWERKMEFLLNQQARFDAEMYELKEAQARTEETVERTTKNVSHLAGLMTEGFSLTMNLIKELGKQADAEMKELREAQKLTDEALRKLITRFDRHLSEDQPGLNN